MALAKQLSSNELPSSKLVRLEDLRILLTSGASKFIPQHVLDISPYDGKQIILDFKGVSGKYSHTPMVDYQYSNPSDSVNHNHSRTIRITSPHTAYTYENPSIVDNPGRMLSMGGSGIPQEAVHEMVAKIRKEREENRNGHN